MEDGSCAVCAEEVEWVAYGVCGHRDVCATCIARLRFVCLDLRCCICKSPSPSVFVTKALGSLTRVINDFSILPAEAKEGRVGSYWYHEDTQAYFDDSDEYKIIKSMCRVSCSVCDKSEVEQKRSSNKRGKFKSIEHLKDHLSRQHDLSFCNLCLENKKVFICEQKLYTRVQLIQHIRDGNSEVDGDECCGFSGHPFCEFCQKPFYGDNELYSHMSREHYTCHICQREHSTQYEYYRDYNDLENHFRQAHFLCEDDSCLEKKFIVFATEADIKRHNALEHGGHMSRSKRSAALQLPTSFHYRERAESHHVRAHVSGRDASDHQLFSSTPRSAERTGFNLLQDDASLIVQATSPGHSGNVLLSGSAFPPLPRTSKRRRRKSKKNSEETSTHSEATLTHSSTPTNSAANNSSTAFSPVTSDVGPSYSSANPFNVLASTASDVGPSSSAPNLVLEASVGPSVSSEPREDAQAANKAMVERILAALDFDKDKYAAFRIVSKEYRDSKIDATEYLAYVHQFGLMHLIPDLARVCPDPQKRKELVEAHKTSLGDSKENGVKRENDHHKRSDTKSKGSSKKGKEKSEDSKGKALKDKTVNHLRELKLESKPCKEEETSSSSKGESGKHEDEKSSEERAAAKGGKKKHKKNSKFLRTRVGESSSSGSGVSELNCCDLASELILGRPNQDSILAEVRGVWRNGGGRRLVALSLASPSTR